MEALDVLQFLGKVVAHLGGAVFVSTEVALRPAGAFCDVGHIELLQLVTCVGQSGPLLSMVPRLTCFTLSACWRTTAGGAV